MKKFILSILSFSILFSFSVANAFDWKAHSGKTITILMNEHPVLDGIRSLISEFEEDTGIKVKVNALAEDLYFDRMEVNLRGAKGADAHFCPMDATAFNQYGAGLLQPLNGFLDDPSATHPGYDVNDFPSGFLNATNFPGGPGSNYYCIPMSFESYIVFYNKDLVNKYLGGKLPETMDELIAMANKVKADSGGEVAGAVMRGLRTDTNIDTISGLVFNAWGDRPIEGPYGVWFDGDWSKPRLDDPAIQKGLSDYAGLMTAGPSDILSYNWNEAGNAFCAGQAAFFADASLFGPWFETDDCPSVKGNTGYMALPPQAKGGTSYTANWQWGIGMGANAQEKDAGWYFIQYMTDKHAEPKIGTFHGGAGRLSTWENDDYTSTLNPDYVSATLESMKTVRTSVVPVQDFNKYALEIMDVILRIHGGASSADATAEGNANFQNM